MLIMHGTFKDLLADFILKHPEYDGLIGKDKFRELAPWNLRKVKREGCLCLTCVNCAMAMKALKLVAAQLKRLLSTANPTSELNEDRNVADGVDGAGAELGSTGGSTSATAAWVAEPKRRAALEAIIKLCTCTHKHEHVDIAFCSPVTPECLKGKCPKILKSGHKCGFSPIWETLRSALVTRENGKEVLRTNLPPGVVAVFSSVVELEKYVSITSKTKKTVTRDEEEDPTYGASQHTSSRLDTEKTEESLIAVLDYLRSIFLPMCMHRDTLRRCKKSMEELLQNCPVGWVLHDVDWAENFTIVKAMMIQAEYWAQIQSSLFIGIMRWLCKDTYDDIETRLEMHDEVTVHEPNGEKRWSKIIAVHGDGESYDLRDSNGVESKGVWRRDLHKRKWISHAYTGFSDDKLHDSYQTQHFMNMQLEDAAAAQLSSGSRDWLCDATYNSTTCALSAGDIVTVEEAGYVPFQAKVLAAWRSGDGPVKLRSVGPAQPDGPQPTVACARECVRLHKLDIVYCIHSDNAAQHFKSVKALVWLSLLMGKYEWISRAYWGFGCPGRAHLCF